MIEDYQSLQKEKYKLYHLGSFSIQFLLSLQKKINSEPHNYKKQLNLVFILGFIEREIYHFSPVMSRPNPSDYSIELKDWEELGHGVGHILGEGNSMAGQEGNGYRTYHKG